MNIHEYQARQLFDRYGIAIPEAHVVHTAQEAAVAFKQLGTAVAVVKAQVYAGGRGKGGGVQLVRSAEQAKDVAQQILEKPLVTPQTGPDGVWVHQLLVAAGVEIVHEYYLAIAVDRSAACPVLIASEAGGMDIEQVADATPEAIIRERIDPVAGLQPFQASKIAYFLGFSGLQAKIARQVITQLSRLFLDTDASLAEINPLVTTVQGQLLAIDAKINFDDNALYRQDEIQAMTQNAQTNPAEVRAAEHDLSYIKLEGNIGCLVNGAGLAMATMDMIKLHGAEPANFLDVGGSASEQAVTEAFRIILEDPNVKGILVNIFGGIAKCDTIARAIIQAAKEIGFSVPLVVRLEGTNVQIARELLEQAKDDLPTMGIGLDLTDAAKKITAQITTGV